MNLVRDWILAAAFGAAVIFLGFGCATKSGTSNSGSPASHPVQPATNGAPTAATTPAVYVPDMTHVKEPLPDGVLAWDALLKTTDATNGQDFARFIFSFTNIAKKIDLGLATNVTSLTNFTTVTNSGFWAHFLGHNTSRLANIQSSTNMVTVTNSITPVSVTIVTAPHPSCGCTTAEVPPIPWTIPAGSNGQIKVTVNLAGKSGTLFKQVNVSTDKGNKNLMLRVNILPPPPRPEMTEAQRAAGIATAKVDRQAVFKGDCASCHAKNMDGKYGQQLFASVCAVCHEAEHRSTMVPDLHALKIPTNEDFWRTWIAHGKAGSLMPAFSTAEGGPLTDMQITSLAAYLNMAIPSKVPPPQ